jgi:Protein of unknown function (DUF3024)
VLQVVPSWPPAQFRDEVDLAFRFDGRSVEIFEIRPRWRNPAEKTEKAVAKARYFKSRDERAVYWKRADGKWHGYDPAANVKTIHAFLRIVDEDEYGCFFG